MGKLTEWCAGQPALAIDALQRVATSTTLQPRDVDALVERTALAHGLHIEGERPCLPFDENGVIFIDDPARRCEAPLNWTTNGSRPFGARPNA